MKKPKKLTPEPEPARERRIGYQVSLNPSEAERIDGACAKTGLMRSTFMRIAALEKADRS